MKRRTLLAGAGALALGARGMPLAAQSLPTVRVLYEPIDTATAIFAAREMGFFKQAGIDVALQPAWLGANLDAAKRFNAAMRLACAYANHNRDKTAELAAGFMNLDAAVIRGRVRATFAETRGFGAAQIVLDQGVKYGVLKAPVATSSLTLPQLAV